MSLREIDPQIAELMGEELHRQESTRLPPAPAPLRRLPVKRP